MALSHVFSGSVSARTPDLRNVATPSAVDVGGTLTASNVINGYNTSVAAGPGDIQFPTAASIAAALDNPLALKVGDSFLFFQFTTGASDATMTTNTGLTLLGTMVTNASGGQFLFRCTAAATNVNGTGATFSVTRVG
jgi:hypothetical protein